MMQLFAKILDKTLSFRIAVLFLSLFVLCYGSGEWKHLIPEYPIHAIEPYEGGFWFSAGEKGALRYESATGEWYFYNKSSGHMNQTHELYGMRIMHERVWFATTYGMYSCKTNGSDWQQHILPGGVYGNWIRGFDANSSTIWIASFGGLYSRPASGGSFKFHDVYIPGLGSSKIGYSVAATDSIIWYGTEDGLIRYDISLPIEDTNSVIYYFQGNGFTTASQNISCSALCVTEEGLWIGLEEYTPLSTPNFCVGGLFYKQGDKWTRFDQDQGLPAGGIHFIHEYGKKIYAGLFHYVNGVYYRGAGLLELDPSDSSLRVLNADNWHITNNDVRALYISGRDTLVGTDAGLFSNLADLRGMTPDEAPAGFSLRNLGGLGNSAIEIKIAPLQLASDYIVYYSKDSESFTDSLIISSNCDTLRTLEANELYYFKVAGMNSHGKGPAAPDILACFTGEEKNTVLMVQAYAKKINSNTYDYVRQHGRVLLQSAYGCFDSATGSAIGEGYIQPADYSLMNWIAGMDDNSLTEQTKNVIAEYLKNGGKLIITGSHIQENLSKDANFYRDYLKAKALKDNSNIFSIETLPGGIFEGIGDFEYGKANLAAYQVFRPDAFRVLGTAKANCIYSGSDSSSIGVAGLQYTGTFADSEKEASLFYLGFPFESIFPDSLQDAVMRSVLNYMGFDITLSSLGESSLASDFYLAQNYPNPFNAETRIRYRIPVDTQVCLDLYDISGKKLRNIINSTQNAGEYSVVFRSEDLPSGLYVYKLEYSGGQQVRKMLLLK